MGEGGGGMGEGGGGRGGRGREEGEGCQRMTTVYGLQGQSCITVEFQLTTVLNS